MDPISDHSARIRGVVGALRHRLMASSVARCTIWAAVVSAPVAFGLAYGGWLSLAMVVVAGAYVCGAVVGVSQAPKRSAATAILDRACDGGELVVTAAAIAEGRSGGGRFARFIMADAAKRLDRVTPAGVAPLAILPTAMVVAMLAFVGPWLISAPGSLSLAIALGRAQDSTQLVKQSSVRPGRGEIVRRSTAPPSNDKPDQTNNTNNTNTNEPNPASSQPINPRIPGLVPETGNGDSANANSRTPSAGVGAGEGTTASNRRNQPTIPMSLRAAAINEIRVVAPRGGSLYVSASIPASYRQIVADFMSETR